MTVPQDTFEDHLKWLQKYGYRTIDIDELYAHVSGEQPLPRRSVFLTFDDGYLDNWMYVAPLLTRYGFKGTVFVNPEFVDPRDIVRPSLHDVWNGKISGDALDTRGFMSWPELKQLVDNGPLAVHSHAMTHTWYPVSDRIVDFHHPDDGYYWLDWNANPEMKPFYLRDPRKTEVPYGMPIYEHEKSLVATRYFPDQEEGELLVNYVRCNGGADFFQVAGWRETLMQKVDLFRKSKPDAGRRESPDERHARYMFELHQSSTIIEQRLGKKTHFLCWPGGGYNPESQGMALQVYKAVTLGSRDVSLIRNRTGENPQFVKRIGVPYIMRREQFFYPGGSYLVKSILEYQGSKFSRFRRQLHKLLYISQFILLQNLKS